MSTQSLYSPEDRLTDGQAWTGTMQQFHRPGQAQSYPSPQWQEQVDYPQHFDQEAKRPFYLSSPALPLQVINRSSLDTVATFPLPAPRMVSPAPSQELSTPTSSNARSPATDPDWYPDPYNTPQIHDDLPFPNELPYLSPDIGAVCTVRPPANIFSGSAGFPCVVNLSQVQSFIDQQDFTDPPETVFEPDERYLDMEQTEYAIEVDPRPSRGVEVRAASRRSLASSGRHETSLDTGYIQEQDPAQTMVDVDGDMEDDDEILEEQASDTDYTPKRTRSNRRRTTNFSKPSSSSSHRRGRAAKSRSLGTSKSSKGHSALACKTCKAPFNDSASLQRHVESAHTRAFTCVFNFAGCSSTFASKNEWKRHVATQHLNFYTWVCNLDACGKTHAEASSSSKKESGGASSKGATFNRKDLFTQHLRRMHAPHRKRPDKQKSAWDDRIKDLQKTSQHVNRQGPRALKCPVAECGAHFSGSKCWDDRMEHVAKHLEKVAETKGAAIVQHENDELLVKWAQNEGIINRVDGKYELIPINTWLDGLEDAEGEDEY
jgi:hypothetical protein